jgi:hypothetical protein
MIDSACILSDNYAGAFCLYIQGEAEMNVETSAVTDGTKVIVRCEGSKCATFITFTSTDNEPKYPIAEATRAGWTVIEGIARCAACTTKRNNALSAAMDHPTAGTSR